MKIKILGLLLLTSSQVFAHESLSSDKYVYADMYATMLVSEFDRELDSAIITKSNPLETLTYAKLQSARSYKEALSGHHHGLNTPSLLLPTFSAEAFSSVIDEINQDAEEIFLQTKEISEEVKKLQEIDPPYAYPSTSAKGNLFGKDFPKDVWAMTFDDGPRSVRTATIVDNLLARNLRATFFMLTAEAKRFKTAALDVRDRGMHIALHSYDHANLPKVSDAKLKYEITDAKNDLESLLEIDIEYFRLPYGAGVHNSKIRKLIADNKMIHVFWNIDTLDWQDHNPTSVLKRAVKLMKTTPNNSGIILFHDIHQSTIEASRLLMDYLLENNNKICSLKEIVDGLNGEAQSCY